MTKISKRKDVILSAATIAVAPNDAHTARTVAQETPTEGTALGILPPPPQNPRPRRTHSAEAPSRRR